MAISVATLAKQRYQEKLQGGDLTDVSDDALLDFIRNVDQPLTKVEKQARTQQVTRFLKYQNDSQGFVKNILGGHLWSKQQEIAQSVFQNRYTAVRSCHGTGKSAIAARVAAQWISCNEPGDAFVVTSAPTFPQVRGILWREINRVHRIGHLPGHTNQTEWHLGGELVAFGRKPGDDDMTAFQGIHALKVLIIFDEACGIPLTLWNAAETLMTNDDCHMLAIGNPDDPAAHFHTVCKPGSGWNVIHISAFMSPNFTGEEVPGKLRQLLISKQWVEERRRKWGDQSPLYISKVMGDFPDVSDDVLIPFTLLANAQRRDEMTVDKPVRLGVDVARFGRDYTVIYLRQGFKYTLHNKFGKQPTTFTTGEVLNAINETGATEVMVDDTGVGGGVTDQLNEHRRLGRLTARIIPVNFGAAPMVSRSKVKANVVFFDLKTQIYWMFREQLMADPVIIKDEDTLSQLGSMKYTVLSNSAIRMENKDDYKKRTGLPSPDEGDACVLASVDPDMVPRPRRLHGRSKGLRGFSLFRR